MQKDFKSCTNKWNFQPELEKYAAIQNQVQCRFWSTIQTYIVIHEVVKSILIKTHMAYKGNIIQQSSS